MKEEGQERAMEVHAAGGLWGRKKLKIGSGKVNFSF